MDGFRDRLDDALRKASAPALERIRKDRDLEGLPAQVRKLLVYLELHLFERELNVTAWRRGAGVRDNSVSTDFRDWLGTTPLNYLAERRLETSARMLAANDLELRQIAHGLGFTSYRAFRDRYKAWTGRRPSEDRGNPPAEIDFSSLRQALRGEATSEEAERLIVTLRKMYPAADAAREPPQTCRPPVVRMVVDGADYERFQADGLWRQIRTLPSEEQARHVRRYLFQSTAFFDLLRKKSREEGRRGRERGVAVAELALVSLEGHEEVFGDRIHDLRALGWASLANARRLALDAEGAEADLKRADREWSVPRAERDLTILAEIQLMRSALRTSQARYQDALEYLSESIQLSRRTDARVIQAQALIQRATVHGYLEDLDEMISDLRSALNVDHRDPYLEFTGTCNLAHGLARLGRAEEAMRWVGSLEKLSGISGQPLLQHQGLWVQAVVKHGLGDREAAELLYLRAQSGFAALGELTAVALVSLDLSILWFENQQGLRGSTAAREAVEILQSLNLGREPLAAVELLGKELEAQRISTLLLRKTQQRLHRHVLLQP